MVCRNKRSTFWWTVWDNRISWRNLFFDFFVVNLVCTHEMQETGSTAQIEWHLVTVCVFANGCKEQLESCCIVAHFDLENIAR